MKYICPVCGYVYDEEKEGTAFADLPADWACPLCKAPKSSFGPEKAPEAAPALQAEAAGRLSWGQMAALCTSLSRACEKQYRPKQAEEFAFLAEKLAALAEPVRDVGVERMAALLAEELAAYPGVRAAVDAQGDRGAARALVWGEKVDRMLSALLEQYAVKGEALLEGTQVWVCTACGFVYIGDAPPEQCPVCRVPAWKFEKVEG